MWQFLLCISSFDIHIHKKHDKHYTNITDTLIAMSIMCILIYIQLYPFSVVASGETLITAGFYSSGGVSIINYTSDYRRGVAVGNV